MGKMVFFFNLPPNSNNAMLRGIEKLKVAYPKVPRWYLALSGPHLFIQKSFAKDYALSRL